MLGRIIIFSGAGLSAESGISTFRDQNGLWENHKIEEICNIHTWRKNKEKVFKFYNDRRQQLATVEPSAGHKMIAKLQEELGVESVINITQNVDDLLERAGVKNVIHVHGQLERMMCCDFNHKWEVGYRAVDIEEKCPKCGSKDIKPDVVFFSEAAPNYQTMYDIFNSVNRNDIIVVIGTMGNVVPIEWIIRKNRAFKILNNLEKSPYINSKMFNLTLYGSIKDMADTIYDEIKKQIEHQK